MPFYAAWHFCKEGSLKENGNCFRVSDGYYYNRFFREAEARWGDIFYKLITCYLIWKSEPHSSLMRFASP